MARGRQNFVTILANYHPFQDPQGGPNFFMVSTLALELPTGQGLASAGRRRHQPRR